jgi:hypothetical protein
MSRLVQYLTLTILFVMPFSFVGCPPSDGGGGGNDTSFELYFFNSSVTTVNVETLDLVNQLTGQLENVLDETVEKRGFLKLVLSAEKFATGFATLRLTGQTVDSHDLVPFIMEASGFRVGPGPCGIALVNVGEIGSFVPILSAFNITDARDAKGVDTFNFYMLNVTGLSVSTVELNNLQTGARDSLLLAPIPPFTLLIQPVLTAIQAGPGSEVNIVMETGQSLPVGIGQGQFGPEPEALAVIDRNEAGDITPIIRFVTIDDSVE